MTHDPEAPVTVHVGLPAGHDASGQPVFEVLPARPLPSTHVRLLGSPGPVLGCAMGDVIRVGDDGGFEVVRHGGNLCVQAYRPGAFTPESYAPLGEAAEELDALVEAPRDLRFIVLTVGRAGGPAAVGRVMDAWAEGVDGAAWSFGNGESPA
ncbi:DUF4265 domain-containing protein [Kitasatospora paranensis]|uniref:DUF4265 domain-containing protein n=1 Tax=Kitasatospora paranensis TaxID=258053 RepID=A0ABW2GB35_9ACTN